MGLQGFERRHRCHHPASRTTVGRRPTRRTELTDVPPPPRVAATAARSAANDLEMGSPTVGKAPGNAAARCFATALHDLHCVPLSRRTWGLRGPSSGAESTTQAVNSLSLLTFGAVFPDAVRLLPPGVGTPDCLSWGCRRSPLRRARPRSPLPDAPLRVHPSGRRLPTPTMFRPRGFSPPRRFAPPRPCRDVAPDCRPWGSPRFRPLRGVIPATPFRPPEPCSPDAAPVRNEFRPVGCGQAAPPCRHAVTASPAPLPPRR